MEVEKKMDMTLDDIIKANRGGNGRKNQGQDAANGGSKTPKAQGGIRKKGGGGRNQGQRSQPLPVKQSALKKKPGRAPIHVTTNSTSRVPGLAMSITIDNTPKNKGGRRSPPPGFAGTRAPTFATGSMQPPPGLSRRGGSARGGNPVMKKPSTLNERFSQFSQSGTPAVAVAMKAAGVSGLKGKRNRNRRNRNKGTNKPSAMEQ